MRLKDQILQQLEDRLCISHKQFTTLWTDHIIFLRILEAQLWIGSSLSKVHSSTQVVAAPVLDEAVETYLEAWLTWYEGDVDDGMTGDPASEPFKILHEEEVGFDAKGVAPSTRSHYERNTRKLHDSPPDKPLAIIIRGTSLTIAKGLNKIIDKERAAALKEGNKNYKAFIPTMMDSLSRLTTV